MEECHAKSSPLKTRPKCSLTNPSNPSDLPRVLLTCFSNSHQIKRGDQQSNDAKVPGHFGPVSERGGHDRQFVPNSARQSPVTQESPPPPPVAGSIFWERSLIHRIKHVIIRFQAMEDMMTSDMGKGVGVL